VIWRGLEESEAEVRQNHYRRGVPKLPQPNQIFMHPNIQMSEHLSIHSLRFTAEAAPLSQGQNQLTY